MWLGTLGLLEGRGGKWKSLGTLRCLPVLERLCRKDELDLFNVTLRGWIRSKGDAGGPVSETLSLTVPACYSRTRF